MDLKENSHSFQNIAMSHVYIIEKILSKYNGKLFGEITGIKTGIPVVQYRETDWQFINRMAGYMGLGVFSSESMETPGITIGLCKTGAKAEFCDEDYQSIVDEEYYHGGKEGSVPKKEFLYYQVKSDRNYKIGDYVYYKGQKRYIFHKEAEWRNGELQFCYKIGGKYRFRRKKEYNEKIAGISLGGEIVKAEKETVYIRLDIDEDDGKAIYPYPWKPVSGNVLYSMPQAGTRAYLYFPDCREERAFVGNSMYTGGMKKIPHSPQNRVLETEYGKQLLLCNDMITLRGDSEMAWQEFSMEAEGCTLKVEGGKLSFTAKEGIIFKAPNIVMCSPLEINQFKNKQYASGKKRELQNKGSRNPATGGDTSFFMQYEFNGMSSQGVLCGTVYEEYLPFDDAPTYEINYSKGAKIAAGMGIAVLVGIAVGALVFLAAPAVVVAGVAISAAQIGMAAGAVAGIAATVCTAMNDDGNTPMSEYTYNALWASVEVGATMIVLSLAQYAAEVMTAMANPLGTATVPIFGHWIPASVIENAIGLGVAEVAGFNVFFSLMT